MTVDPELKTELSELAAIVILSMHLRMHEVTQGRPPSRASHLGPKVMAALIQWRLHHQPVELDFDGVVREHTAALLRKLDPDLDEAHIHEMIDDMLELTSKLIRKYAN
jgi:hypothetical protein